MSLSKALMTAAETAATLAVSLPPPLNIVAGIASAALKAGTAFAEAGKDPVVEITRVLSSDPQVQQVHDDWDRMMNAKFGTEEGMTMHGRSFPGLPPDVPGDAEDPYENL